ncbi:maleylpyruvate isomerase family mycothiol-dependent enzyme [Actinoalloteichus hymeniacidonis]|uniref:Maleylpyruvate isomerase family mycothiol-dependent enzyme n=1 Tax=Actinoalloteichus hymeniacidonis TaxID=340345 RepID=A0AAC9MZ14_9PSEU|nr:maleylpyruvate isomerase family mycothiol-dependent enzyme [Actinoalloteichus hymeniacidonis]AOS63885.1 hypothetical protein TL08_15380 [Actinoalloteichus hymeniacidonis]MBB5908059.1 uncharacterized protein (TIGR03083 family) [Actinoalloteichus hymeniacidonis]
MHTTTEFIETLHREGERFADTAEHVDLTAPVPGCPAWSVRDLVLHLGAVHRWATGYVVEGRTQPEPIAEAPALEDTELAPWLRDGHARLVAALTEAPAELDCWTFLPTGVEPLEFWARRQAYETSVHRVDIEAASGLALSPMAPEFASGGIDEFLRGFQARPSSPVRTETPKTLRILPTDVPAAGWTVSLSADKPPRTERTRDGQPADCTYTGPAMALYLVLYNRLPIDAVQCGGDVSLAQRWRDLTSS